MLSFPKSERLKGKTTISALMKKGRWGCTAALKYCCIKRPDGEGGNRVLVSVPKRFFKQAVKRNLLKRRMRESYRIMKDLASGNDILFIYNTDKILSQNEIGVQMKEILNGLETETKR